MLEQSNNLEQALKRDFYQIIIEMPGRRQKQMKIFSKDSQEQLEFLYYCNIYSSFSEMLNYVIEDLCNGKTKRSDLARCYRCEPPVEMVGENNLETWMLLGGIIICFREDGITHVEARNYCYNEEKGSACYGNVFFSASKKTLGECLEAVNEQMNHYNLLELEDILEFYASPTPEMIEKRLTKVAKV